MTPSSALFARLVRLVHLVGQAGARELSGFGLTPAQYQLLVLVDSTPGRTQQQITDSLGVTKGNVSQLVSRLQQAGLLQREPRGQEIQITVTEEGRRLLAALVPAHDAFLTRSFAVLDVGELQFLTDLVERLTAHQAGAGPTPLTTTLDDHRTADLTGGTR